MPRHLVLRLEGPLMAFGDVMVDRLGPVRATPSASTLTGLLANALGVYRWECARLERLQSRLVFGCRLDRRGHRFADFQTAQLAGDDRGWTTRGRSEGRAGGSSTYDSPHIRERDHDADARVTVAVRLLDADDVPTLDDLARAIDEPARPLFLGRKTCLPAVPLLVGIVEAPSVYAALLAARIDDPHALGASPRVDGTMLFVLPADEPRPPGFHPMHACERRDWTAGVHAGDMITYHGQVPRDHLASSPTDRS